MEFFEIFFYWVCRSFLLPDLEIWALQMCHIWFVGIVMTSLATVLFCFNLVIIIFEGLYASIGTLIGSAYVGLPVPIISIKRANTYIDILLNHFSTDPVSRTEEFTPPFVFGYRKYSFARIVGWRGTWASFLKLYRRRIKSSVFEWGYKGRIPSWHYYTIRGGLRIQIVTPNHFRRVSGSSYYNPQWFYSFPIRPKKRGFRGDERDQYFFSAFKGSSHYRRLYALYRQVERPRTRYLYLSAWLEKCAPSMHSKYRKSTEYVSATDPRSPYAYVNFPTYYTNTSKVTHRRSTHLGMEQAVLYVDTTAHEVLKPRLMRMFRTFIPDSKLPYLHTLFRPRKVGSIGKYLIIDKEAWKMKIFLIKYVNYTTGPSREYNRDYDYSKFLSLYWYHTFVEFLSIIFESFYIYPFESEVVSVRIISVPESGTSHILDTLFEWLFGPELILNSPVVYFIVLFLYFMISAVGLEFVTLLVRSIYADQNGCGIEKKNIRVRARFTKFIKLVLNWIKF